MLDGKIIESEMEAIKNLMKWVPYPVIGSHLQCVVNLFDYFYRFLCQFSSVDHNPRHIGSLFHSFCDLCVATLSFVLIIYAKTTISSIKGNLVYVDELKYNRSRWVDPDREYSAHEDYKNSLDRKSGIQMMMIKPKVTENTGKDDTD